MTKKRILEFIKNQNITVPIFFQKTGIKRGFLDSDKLDQAVSDRHFSMIIAAFPDLSLDWLLTGEGPMLRSDLPAAHPATEPGAGIPLIPIEAVAGLPTDDPVGTRFIDCAHYIIPDFANLNVEYMIRVSGSSMYPKYSNGDILACRRVHDVLFFQWGKIYVIDSSQGALVKRVFQDEDPDRILLVSDNRENYPPFSIPKSDIRSLSIVVGVIRLE